MKKFTKLITIFLMVLAILVTACSCTSADMVNHNLSQSADNFQCVRKITVYNARVHLIVFEMEGAMSISNSAYGELIVTCMVGPNQYKKNYIYLNEWVIYVVEDISNTVTDPYHYKVHFYAPIPDIDINH